jgi:hypothetical protein
MIPYIFRIDMATYGKKHFEADPNDKMCFCEEDNLTKTIKILYCSPILQSIMSLS